jgi:carbon monoxide dehydrogenase subunit G
MIRQAQRFAAAIMPLAAPSLTSRPSCAAPMQGRPNMANALEFAGDEQFRAPAARVRALFADLRRILGLLPNVDSVEALEDDDRGEDGDGYCGGARGVVRPGFSFLRGKLTVTIRHDRSPAALADPETIALVVNSKGIGVGIDLVAQLTIAADSAPADAPRTTVRWSAKITQLSGLVVAVSKPLIGAAAEQVIRDSWQRIHAALDESE